MLETATAVPVQKTERREGQGEKIEEEGGGEKKGPEAGTARVPGDLVAKGKNEGLRAAVGAEAAGAEAVVEKTRLTQIDEDFIKLYTTG